MNTTIAFTLSPPNRSMTGKYRNPQKHFYDGDRQIIMSTLKYDRISRYIIHPEFDDKGRLHYHGIITLNHNEQVRFYKHGREIIKRLGYVDIKPLASREDKIRWVGYMRKGWRLASETLEITQPMIGPALIEPMKKASLLRDRNRPPPEEGVGGGALNAGPPSERLSEERRYRSDSGTYDRTDNEYFAE